MKLIKYKSNWADEMDVQGWSVMSPMRHAAWEDSWADHFKDEGNYSFSVGTNEDIEYDSIEEFLKEFKVVDITESEADTLVKLFGKSYGFFP